MTDRENNSMQLHWRLIYHTFIMFIVQQVKTLSKLNLHVDYVVKLTSHLHQQLNWGQHEGYQI